MGGGAGVRDAGRAGRDLRRVQGPAIRGDAAHARPARTRTRGGRVGACRFPAAAVVHAAKVKWRRCGKWEVQKLWKELWKELEGLSVKLWLCEEGRAGKEVVVRTGKEVGGERRMQGGSKEGKKGRRKEGFPSHIPRPRCIPITVTPHAHARQVAAAAARRLDAAAGILPAPAPPAAPAPAPADPALAPLRAALEAAAAMPSMSSTAALATA